jgi:hypothetical protein
MLLLVANYRPPDLDLGYALECALDLEYALEHALDLKHALGPGSAMIHKSLMSEGPINTFLYV